MPDAYVPGAPLSTWGLVEMSGEGTYEGSTALLWTNLVDETCACMDPDHQCEWQVLGVVFEGEMPPAPVPLPVATE